ncbi:MAG: YdcF family protein [Polyangiaceae bacterium]
MTEVTNRDLPPLASAVDAYARAADDSTRDAAIAHIRERVDAWLFRVAPNHDTGLEIADWLGRANAETADAVSTDRLAHLGRLYGFRPADLSGTLSSATSWKFARLVSSPNPKNAIESSRSLVFEADATPGTYLSNPEWQGPITRDQDCLAWLAILGAGGEYGGALADGRVYRHGFLYYCMPLRAAFLRAILLEYARLDAVKAYVSPGEVPGELGRLSGVASSVKTVSLPIPTKKPTVISGTMMFALLLTEALDDDTYCHNYAEPPPAAEETAYEYGEERLTKAGEVLRDLIVRSVAGDPWPRDSEVEQALKSYAAMHGLGGEPRAVHVRPGGGPRQIVSDPYPQPFDAVIVPGYTALSSDEVSKYVSEEGARRVDQALKDLQTFTDIAGVPPTQLAPFVVMSGGGVYPLGTDQTEAELMRKYALSPDSDIEGAPARFVIREPRARHSTTNLRNASRLLMAYGLHGPYLITTGGEAKSIDTGAIVGTVAAGAMGVAGTAMVIASQTIMKGNDDADEVMTAGAVMMAGGALAAMIGVIPLMDDQAFYFQSPWWSQYNSRCKTELGYRPHWFIGDSSEFCTFCESGPYGTNDEEMDQLDKDAWARLRKRYLANKDFYKKLDKRMHAVLVPHPRVLRINIRDPLDP